MPAIPDTYILGKVFLLDWKVKISDNGPLPVNMNIDNFIVGEG